MLNQDHVNIIQLAITIDALEVIAEECYCEENPEKGHGPCGGCIAESALKMIKEIK